MKKYITRVIKYWDKSRVYMYDLSCGEETILRETCIDETINNLNQEGFFLSAIGSRFGDCGYYLTKEVE